MLVCNSIVVSCASAQEKSAPITVFMNLFPIFASSAEGVKIVKIADHGVLHRYFDTSPISPSGRYVALLRVPYEDKMALPGDAAEVLLVDLQKGEERVIGKSRGWGHQLGANVQWGRSDHELYFNDVDPVDWSCFAIKLDPFTGERRRLGGTVFMVSPDGSTLASDNQKKTMLFVQKGYGVAVPEAYVRRNIGPVEDDGIYLTDTATGHSRMLVSIREIYDTSVPSIRIAEPTRFEYYCFAVKWNPQGTRLLTTLQWTPLTGGKRFRTVITMRPDGSEIRTAVTAEQWRKGGHHVNWAPDGEHLTMNLEADGTPGLELVRFRADGSELEIIYPKGSGHPSVNPHYPFVITDAYTWEPFAKGDDTAPLRLLDLRTKRETTIANIYLGNWKGKEELRVDAHPAWDASGRYIVFDGYVGDTRNVYLMYLGPLALDDR
jgi:hypothetical protein